MTRYIDLEYTGLSLLYYQLLLEDGRTEKIISDARLEEDEEARLIALAAVNFKLGNNDKAEMFCSQVLEKNFKNCAYWLAFAHAYGDDPEKVFIWLDKSLEAKENGLTFLGVEPAFKKYRNDPRVKKLLRAMKFPL